MRQDRRSRRARAGALLLALASALTAACSTTPEHAAVGAAVTNGERPVVAVTTNILADVVRAVGGDEVEVIDLMPRGADPHSYSLSAADTRRVLEADLVVTNGLGLEEGIATTLRQASGDGVPVLEIGPALAPLPYRADIAAKGPTLDPHVWTDPLRMVDAAGLIADELAGRVAPNRARAVRDSADRFRNELRSLDADIARRTAALPPERRRLVTNHHVLGYFADRYGFEVIGAVIPSGTTLASPSARDLADLAGRIRQARVPAIFAETSQPDRLVQVLADEVGLRVRVARLYSESLGPPDSPASTYLGMMRYNASTIVDALSGS